MKKMFPICAGLAVAAVLGVRPVMAAPPSGSTLLVIPARYTVVQFAFDIAQLRSMYLVSYDQPAGTDRVLLYAWDNTRSDWVSVDEADLSSGALFNVQPRRTVLVGDAQTLPASVASAVTARGNPKRIQSLNLADIANGLDSELQFKAREWQWLADRYNFNLEDRNATRRRYGRYGPWGSESSAPGREAQEHMPPSVETLPMPVATPAPVERQTLVIPAASGGAPAAAAVVEPDSTRKESTVEKGAAAAPTTGATPARMTIEVSPAPPAETAPEDK